MENVSRIPVFSNDAYDLLLRKATTRLTSTDPTSVHDILSSLTNAPPQLLFSDPETIHSWIKALIDSKPLESSQHQCHWLALLNLTIRYTPSHILATHWINIADLLTRLIQDETRQGSLFDRSLLSITCLVIRFQEVLPYNLTIKKACSAMVSSATTLILSNRRNFVPDVVSAYFIAVLENIPSVLRSHYQEVKELVFLHLNDPRSTCDLWTEVAALLPVIQGTEAAWETYFSEVFSTVERIVEYTRKCTEKKSLYPARTAIENTATVDRPPPPPFDPPGAKFPNSASEYLNSVKHVFEVSTMVLYKMLNRNYACPVKLHIRQLVLTYRDVLAFQTIDQLASITFNNNNKSIIDSSEWLWFVQQLIRISLSMLKNLIDTLGFAVAPFATEWFQPLPKLFSKKPTAIDSSCIQRQWVYETLTSIYTVLGPLNNIEIPFLETVCSDLRQYLDIETSRHPAIRDNTVDHWGPKRKRKKQNNENQLEESLINNDLVSTKFANSSLDHVDVACSALQALIAFLNCDTLIFEKLIIGIKDKIELNLVECLVGDQGLREPYLEKLTASAAKALGLSLTIGHGKMTSSPHFDLCLYALRVGLARAQSHVLKDSCREALNMYEAICHPRGPPVFESLPNVPQVEKNPNPFQSFQYKSSKGNTEKTNGDIHREDVLPRSESIRVDETKVTKHALDQDGKKDEPKEKVNKDPPQSFPQIDTAQVSNPESTVGDVMEIDEVEDTGAITPQLVERPKSPVKSFQAPTLLRNDNTSGDVDKDSGEDSDLDSEEARNLVAAIDSEASADESQS